MDYYRLWEIGERARDGVRLTPADRQFIRDVVPHELANFAGGWLGSSEGSPQPARHEARRSSPARHPLPRRVKHVAGFTVSGAVVGTFLRSALLLAAQRALGTRYSAVSAFYDRVERDLAFAIMRSHFHRGFPKGVHCCPPCTLAVYPVLQAEAIRYFDCRELAASVRELITQRQWRFSTFANQRMIAWALK